MKRNEVAAAARAKLRELGIPEHCFAVREIPACVQVSVSAGGARLIKKLRTGLTRPELDLELARLENFVDHRTGTIDLEEAIAEARPDAAAANKEIV